MPGLYDITTAVLLHRIGRHDVPLILDVGLHDDVAANPTRIPGAMPCVARDTPTGAQKLEAKRLPPIWTAVAGPRPSARFLPDCHSFFTRIWT